MKKSEFRITVFFLGQRHNEGGRERIVCGYSFNDFIAIHKIKKEWKITHLPTGLQVATTLTLKDAEFLAGQINNNFGDILGDTEKFKSAVKNTGFLPYITMFSVFKGNRKCFRKPKRGVQNA